MKRGRLSARERARARLLESWQRRPEYGEPIGCVATTFTFDPAHFEEHCLARFLGIQSDPAEDARGYLLEREERLSQAFTCVLVDRAHVSAQRSLRWHLLPVRVGNGGILHAKVSLLVWEKRIRVLVGSANLTEYGYRRNIENLAALDFTRDGAVPLELLHEVIQMLDDVRQMAPGHESNEGPNPALASFLRGVKESIESWAKPEWPRGEPSARLVYTGPNRPSLFEHLAELWKAAPAQEAWVVSPFFDDGDGALATVTALEALLHRRGERHIHVVSSGRRLPDGVVEIDLPACLAGTSSTRAKLHVHLVVPEAGEDPRALHAKSIWLKRDRFVIYCVGSSNFTAAGTGISKNGNGRANVEANIAYQIPNIDDDFGRICEQAYPSYQEIDRETEDVRFIATTSHTPEPTGHAPLPACFGAALYRVRGTDAELALEFVDAPPAGFVIRDEADTRLLSDAEWVEPAYPGHVRVSWPHARPPSHLLVTWSAGDGDRVAIWVVNVADSATLPPPDELRELSLDELIEVLVSARPVHEAMDRIRRRRTKRTTKSGPKVDPHQKVDTRNFLLVRMRRVSTALEELRARIERPVHTREALLWRLRGPLGPLELAKRLIADDPDSAAFLIAETALTLRSTTLQPQGGLSSQEAENALHDVISELRALALEHPAPANLASYVVSTFAEAMR